MVSSREWDWLSSREDSFAIIPLCPTTSTGSSGYHRTELALLISLSSLFLSAVEMLLPQQTPPKKMADATTSHHSRHVPRARLCSLCLQRLPAIWDSCCYLACYSTGVPHCDSNACTDVLYIDSYQQSAGCHEAQYSTRQQHLMFRCQTTLSSHLPRSISTASCLHVLWAGTTAEAFCSNMGSG